MGCPEHDAYLLGGRVFTNLRLLGVVVVSFCLQLGIHHIPATQTLFQIGTISLGDCALGVLVGLCPVTVIEVQKLIRRAMGRVGTTEAG